MSKKTDDKVIMLANSTKGELLNIQKIQDAAQKSTDDVIVIYAEPWTSKEFINALIANNKDTTASTKIYSFLGDNETDKHHEAESRAGNGVYDERTRVGTGGQAAVLKDMPIGDIKEAVYGITTVIKKPKKDMGSELGDQMKKDLDGLGSLIKENKAKGKKTILVIPAEFDKNGNFKRVSMGTNIAAKKLEGKSVSAMTKLMDQTFKSISTGTTDINVTKPILKIKPIEVAKLFAKSLGKSIRSIFSKDKAEKGTKPPIKKPTKHFLR